MFGTGVFEIILLWWGISYFYMFSRKKDETEYIQLNEEQFDQLRYTLAVNDIIPERLCINSNLNNDNINNNQAPPRYDEQVQLAQPVQVAQPIQVAQPVQNTVEETPIKEESFDEDAKESMDIVF